MRRRRRWCWVALLGCSLLMPAVAIAATKDGVSLRLAVAVKPDAAAARGVTIEVELDYDFSSSAVRERALAKEVRFALAPGMRIDPAAAGHCADATIVQDDGVSGCPKSSVVGTGTIVVDARPLLPALLDGKIALYNVTKRGGHYLLFWFTVHVNGKPVSVGQLYRIATSGGQTTLDYKQPPPEQGASALYTPRTVKFTIRDASGSHQPYVSAPASCSHSWPFSVLISTYGGAPTLRTSANARCS